MKINLIQAIIMLSKYTAYGLACQMLFFNLLLANEGNAQKTVSVREVQIVLNSGDLKVKEIFNQIERKSDFRFAIDKNDLKLQLNQKVNINTETKTVSDILIEISRESRLKFRQVNNNITVTRLKDNKVQEEIDFVIEADVDISGKITDENGEGLPGATVIQK